MNVHCIVTVVFSLLFVNYSNAVLQHTQFASLTVSSSSDNDATANTINDDIDDSNNVWKFNNVGETGFSLSVILDPATWGFNNQSISQLTFDFEGSTLTPSDLDVFFVFSRENSNKYIASEIRMDNEANNLITPGCDTESVPTHTFTPYNPETVVANTSNTKKQNLLFSRDWDVMYPGNNNNWLNVWPLQFTLTNDPTYSRTILSYKSGNNYTQNCGFDDSFGTNLNDNKLNMFITGDSADEQFIISRINITYSYDDGITATSNPSKHPIINTAATVSPDISSTANPTTYPTRNDPTFTSQTTHLTNPNIETKPYRSTLISQQTSSVAASGTMKSHILSKESLDASFEFILISVLSIFLLLGLFGFIDSKYIRVNDFYTMVPIIKILLHVGDMISDIFFCLQTLIYIDDDDNDTFIILFVLSICFIIIPIFITLLQLRQSIRKYWMTNNRVRSWLSKYTLYLMAFSILFGSSFASVDLCNSGLFNLELFSMNLHRHYLQQFRTKRLYSITLFENTPQIIIQLIFLILSSNKVSIITICSITLSLISIMITILVIIISKDLLLTQEYGIIKFDITGKAIGDKKKTDPNFVNKMKKIKSDLSDILGVNTDVMEILKPKKISQGLQLQIHIYQNVDSDDNIDDNVDFEACLHFENEKGSIAYIIQNGWHLNNMPIITNIKYVHKQSKKDCKEPDEYMAHVAMAIQMNSKQQPIINTCK